MIPASVKKCGNRQNYPCSTHILLTSTDLIFLQYSNIIFMRILRSIILLSLFYNIPYFLQAQNCRISGYVKEAGSLEPLIGVSITAQGIGAVSNASGFFSLRASDTAMLIVRYMGYEPFMRKLGSLCDSSVQILLQPTQLKEVEISDRASDVLDNDPGVAHINPIQLEKLPLLFGEKDIFKALQMLPGVSAGVEGSAGLLVRGGTVDQNLVLFDGATVFNPAHLFGFLSIVNSDAVKNVNLYKGAFPARYGGRLSSVLEIDFKEGDKQQRHSSLDLGFISSKWYAEGPLRKLKSSYLFSARSSYLGLFLLPRKRKFKTGAAENYFNYWLYDLSGKLSFDLKHNAKLQLSAYAGQDNWKVLEGRPANPDQSLIRWNNRLLSGKYTQPIRDKHFWDLNAGVSQFNFSSTLRTAAGKDDFESIELKSAIREYFLHSGLSLVLGNRQLLRVGAQISRQEFEPVAIHTSPENQSVRSSVNALNGALYLEDEWRISARLRLNAGLRLALYAADTVFHRLEPRFSLVYKAGPHTTIKAGLARSTQFLNLLSNGNSGLPNDVWIPATAKVPPMQAWQASLGLAQRSGQFDAEVELYYKTMRNLTDYKSGGSFLFSFETDWQNLIETKGTGLAYGLECAVHKNEGRLRGAIGYTLARNTRRFDAFNEGRVFPFKYDRRHDLEINADYCFGAKQQKSLGAGWFYQSGQAITVPVAYYFNIEGQFVPLYKEKNNGRAPAYHRLDVYYKIRKTTKRGRSASWTFGAYNAYNRKNPFYLAFKSAPEFQIPNDLNTDIVGQSNFVKQGSFLPLVPYISFSIKF
jgi:hypothetical protein